VVATGLDWRGLLSLGPVNVTRSVRYRIVMKGLLMTGLNPPVPPELLDPVPLGPIVGDRTDDDGIALDEYFEAAPSGPIDWGEVVQQADPTLPQVTRIITRTFTLVGDGTTAPDPVLVLPPDPNRLRLVVICTTTFGWQFGSDKSDVYGAPLMAGNGSTTGYELTGHTGALWIYTSSPTVSLGVKVWAVSS